MFKSTLKVLVDTLFPEQCFSCNNFLIKDEDILCLECLLEFSSFDYELLSDFSIPKNKLNGKIPLKYIFSISQFLKSTIISHLIYNLKYHNKPNLGIFFGKILGNFILKFKNDYHFDFIIPVSLHKKKLQKRGYNQSEYISRGISQILRVPIKDYIIRTKNSLSQTKITDNWKKWENMQNIFKLKENINLNNKNILLVDDVITSGSTLEACAKVLIDKHVNDISIATISYT